MRFETKRPLPIRQGGPVLQGRHDRSAATLLFLSSGGVEEGGKREWFHIAEFRFQVDAVEKKSARRILVSEKIRFPCTVSPVRDAALAEAMAGHAFTFARQAGAVGPFSVTTWFQVNCIRFPVW